MTDQPNITIDIERMTIGDLELLDRAAQNQLPITELVEFLDRIVEEDVRSLPITMLIPIQQELQRRVEEAANPVTEEGN